MPNKYVNKVVIGKETKLDLTADTVTPVSYTHLDVYKRQVTAYDTMSKLDADFSGWLRANQAQFPKTIWQLVQLACQRAGVTLASSSLPINGSYSVQAFYADDLTCLLYTS